MAKKQPSREKQFKTYSVIGEMTYYKFVDSSGALKIAWDEAA
jgi:hypothetical protein